jgi:hypothetical protein
VYDVLNSRDAPTVLDRLEALLGYLDELRESFKSAVAKLVGRSAASAANDFIRLLLGQDPSGSEDDAHDQRYRVDDDPWGEPHQRHPITPYGAKGPPDPDATTFSWLPGWLLVLLSWIAPLASWAGVLLA